MIAVVALVAAARWGADQESVSTDLVVPVQAWEATSTQPSFEGAEDPIEIRALPALPKKDAWEITDLPKKDDWVITALPESVRPTFKPLPKFEGAENSTQENSSTQNSSTQNSNAKNSSTENPGTEAFKIRPLPSMRAGLFGVREGKTVSARQTDAQANSFEANGFEAEISNRQEPEAAPSGSLEAQSFQPRQHPPMDAIKPDIADLSIARRLSVLPTPLTNTERNALPASLTPEVAQGFSVAAASAELEIDALDKTSFSGVAIGTLPKKLADRIAALEPQKKKKKVVAAPKKGEKKAPPKSASAKDDFKLAAQPKFGDHYFEDKPQTDSGAHLMEPLVSDFSADALNPYLPYDPGTQMNVYQGKTLHANQRPLVELGRPWYQLGQLSPGSSLLGFHNNFVPQFLIFGDSRVGYASNKQNGQSDSLIATQLNLDFDLKLTGTERFHAFVSPTGGAQNSRYSFDEDRYIFEGDANIDFGFFEGDLGAIVGGAIGKTLPFDLPFTVGVIPLVFQNGIWMEDAFLGFAATLPAKNSPRLNISNMDITFFAGYDKLDSDAFPGDDSAARVMGIASFIEALNGYIEVDYAFLDDRTFDDRSYHNIGVGYTRRYGRFLSNSTRVIVNAGQSTDVVENTADGVLLLSENSLITGHPTNIVPYFNMFAGFDRPQSVARAGVAGGVLRNTGILFESDNLTGYPTLDATANDTYGFAAGLNLLGRELDQQLVLETAMLGVMGDAATRRAQGDQFGVGFRYQLPLSNSVIFRADGMMGFLRNDDDVSGIRVEMRKKF